MRTICLIFLCLVATSSHGYAGMSWYIDTITGCKVWQEVEHSKKNTFRWSGNCVKGLADGQGVLLIEWYEINPGTFPRPGARPGKQTQTFEGIMKEGKMVKGVFTFESGAKFVGEFRDGEFNYGTYTRPNGGEKYVGEFSNGAFNGKGTFTEKNGDVYSGGFYNGEYHGEGTFTFKNGSSYKGLWEHGHRIKVF